MYAGHGAASFIDLPTGDVVANFEGAVNDPTLMCNVTDMGRQIGTIWNVANFEGASLTQSVNVAGDLFSIDGDPRPMTDIPGLTFDNRINWTSALDGVTLYCGTGEFPQQKSVMLRIYSVILDNNQKYFWFV